MSSSYYNNLIKKILDNSISDIWEEAVLEWEIIDCVEDKTCNSQCICGKDKIRYLYTIFNKFTNVELYPIGSCCIQRFNRNDLDEEIKIQEGMYKLYHAIENYERIDLTSKYFSRKLLQYLYQEGAFQANQYNHYDDSVDYKFMLDMFNKRDKSSITSAQRKKINAIIVSSIKPFLQKTLRYKK